MTQDDATYGFNVQDADALLGMIATQDVEYEEIKPLGSGGSSGSSRIVQSPGGGIAAISGTTVTSASCGIYEISGSTLTSTGTNITVFNLLPFAVPASYYFLAQQTVNGNWIAVLPGVVDLQVSGTTLQETKDGSTWNTWHTGTECT